MDKISHFFQSFLFLVYNENEFKIERMTKLITQIEDKYHAFAPQLKEKLNEEFGSFFTTCEEFFKEQEQVSKNFATFIRSTDPLHSWKNEHHYIVELDDHCLLDLYGTYDPETNELSKSHFRATIPFHETWNSDHFEEVHFNEVERANLLKLQETFAVILKEFGVFLIFDLVEFNPDRDTLPEALVEFRIASSITDFVQTKEVLAFMNAYYAYCFSMKQLFHEKLENSSKG